MFGIRTFQAYDTKVLVNKGYTLCLDSTFKVKACIECYDTRNAKNTA